MVGEIAVLEPFLLFEDVFLCLEGGVDSSAVGMVMKSPFLRSSSHLEVLGSKQGRHVHKISLQ